MLALFHDGLHYDITTTLAIAGFTRLAGILVGALPELLFDVVKANGSAFAYKGLHDFIMSLPIKKHHYLFS